MQKIFKVTTEWDCEGKSIRSLGYCTGDPADIRAYFQDKKTYEIYIEEITIVHIDHFQVKDKLDLLTRKQQIEAELESINASLK